MAWDVFEENPFGGTFPDNSGDLGPEVAGIVGTAAFSGRAEGLTRISGQNGVESPTERVGIECSQIIPDWRRGEIACALGRDEDGAGPVLPLDECPGVKAGFGEHNAQIQASAACAERQSVPGT